MTILTDLQDQALIDELKDRGFTVLNQAELDEIDGDLEAGETVINMLHGLSASISCENDDLSLYLIEQLIFLATGKEAELEFVALAA